jgi:hypothetical protein
MAVPGIDEHDESALIDAARPAAEPPGPTHRDTAITGGKAKLCPAG